MLRDYSSKTLDLGNRHSFRELWKPMGALDEKRLASARERQREQLSLQLGEEVPLYRTHYSSPAYVAYYLLRVKPELTVHIQRGTLDQASRTFCSVNATWLGASERDSSDIKELIPQFYSDSSCFTNERGFAPSGDVELPPWAHGSASEFVQRMREALESDYVSAHLHLWIDLIFGVKQARAYSGTHVSLCDVVMSSVTRSVRQSKLDSGLRPLCAFWALLAGGRYSHHGGQRLPPIHVRERTLNLRGCWTVRRARARIRCRMRADAPTTLREAAPATTAQQVSFWWRPSRPSGLESR